MSDESGKLLRLRAENARLQAELQRLRLGSQAPAAQGGSGSGEGHSGGGSAAAAAGADEGDSGVAAAAQRPAWDGTEHGLSKEQIERYSRQVTLHSFGVHAQARLCRGSVLVVGAGGLGSPAALYLAAAGVGRLGIVDRDAVELSNIHRQVIHRESSVGQHKALSAAAALRALNSSITVEPHLEGLSPANAVALVRQYEVILDASDNAPTRYLLSDACAVARRPLVSGAAIGTDGQLTVYCHGEDGPCYRCLFPVAPRAESCARCVDAGVLGVVPGVIGTLQALEAIKLLCGLGDPLSRRLLLLDALALRFHTVKLRARSPECVACGAAPAITEVTLPGYDYEAFTGQRAANDAAPPPLALIPLEQRIAPAELQDRLASGQSCVVMDVRPPEQFAICHLPGAVQAPYKHLERHLPAIREALAAAAAAGADGTGGFAAGVTRAEAGSDSAAAAAGAAAAEEEEAVGGERPAAGGQQQPALYVVCRRGNDSQRAVAQLRAEAGLAHAVDVVGGMEAWAAQVDPTLPTY